MTHPIITRARQLSRQISRIAAGARKLKALSGNPAVHTAYEIYVDIQVLKDIRKRFNLRMENGSARHLRFPASPGAKANYPYFTARDSNGNPVFQICFGTEYSNHTSTTFAPDISIQTPDSPLAPQCSHICFCMDQKYVSKEGEILDRTEISSFSGLLKVNEPTGSILPQKAFTGVLFIDKNTIITNAIQCTFSVDDLRVLGVCEISEYRPHHRGRQRGP